MKRLALQMIALAAVALLGGCESGMFSEEIPAFPQFKASATSIDFGRIEIRNTAEQALTFSNRGGEGSVLHLYYYLEGDSSFHLATPEREVALRPFDQELKVVVAFAPVRGGGAAGALVVYTSDRPLAEDTRVTTYRIGLRGAAGQGCQLPGLPTFPMPAKVKAHKAANQ